MKSAVKAQLVDLYCRYNHILPDLEPDSATFFKAIVKGRADFGQIQTALKKLAEFLHNKYNERCIVLIDEYDTPFNKAYERGYMKSVIEVVSPIIRNVLKVSG